MQITFKTFADALQWGRTYGRDYVWPFQRWRVERVGNRFALGIYNVNTGKLEGYANA